MYPIRTEKLVMTSGYGKRTYVYNGKKITDFHHGIDLVGGDTVQATADGIVVKVVNKGNYIVLFLFFDLKMEKCNHSDHVGFFKLTTVDEKERNLTWQNKVLECVYYPHFWRWFSSSAHAPSRRLQLKRIPMPVKIRASGFPLPKWKT